MPRRKTTQAMHTPVMAAPKETASADFKVPQFDGGTIDIGKRLEEGRPDIQIVDKLPPTDYADELKFNEDPVTVVLNPSTDRNAAKLVPCWVQGKGAEVWDERHKRWVEFKYLPVARVLTIKRKYLEVLARSRQDTFTTREVTPTPLANQDGYQLEANTVPVAPFSVRHDPAGVKGHEWLARVMAEF